MADDQYLTEKHYLVCDKGVTPKQMKVTSQKFTKIGGHLAATEKDTLLDNNFLCVGGLMFAAGLAAGVCACIPGPGWIVAAAIAVALVAVAAIGYIKCKSNAPTRIWQDTSPVLQIDGKNALLLSSTMMCPKEGGTITPKETFWAAWGTQSLTNLGHIANFAYGFLAGKGIGSIATTGIKEGAKAAGKEFLNTAKNELIEQFTFKGWKNAGWFCRTMRGLGVGGAYYEQYNIWSSDKSILEKLQESGTGLIMGIFAAKGATTVCFPAGTIVHTANGLRNIEDLQVGDWVLTYNEQTAEQEYQPILVKHQRYTQQMMSIELPTGEVLQVTPEHRFYHNGEWIEARSLKVGDLLHLKNGDYTSIIAIEILPNYQKVFNFDIQKNENYYVSLDGILVHNGCNKPRKPSDVNVNIDHSKTIRHNDGSITFTDIKGNSVTYNADGYPDFSPYKIEQADNLKGLNGNYHHDAKIANASIEYDEIPEGYVWHHVEDGKTMQLIPQEIHNNFPHTGGASGLRNGTLP